MTPAFLAVLALAAGAQSPPATGVQLNDAARAIDAGRLDQARLMIAHAMTAGAKGPAVDRLLADLSFAAGNDADALARYRLIAGEPPVQTEVCEKAVIAALRIHAMEDASAMIDCATSGPHASWRSWNARGVLADIRGDWDEADAAYRKAGDLSPAAPAVVNDQGWSYLLRGDWARAHDCFSRAAKLDPKSVRIANNLELAEAAMDDRLPRRRPDETHRSWAMRLNDAGVAAEILGDHNRARAAFTRALEASGEWYSRAGNNLEAVQQK